MKDLFSEQSHHYASYRPNYPDALYAFLGEQLSDRAVAWDCATGNGQVAQSLSRMVERIEATDISERQLQQAYRDLPNVHYSLQPAERTSFPEHSFDLITVAQALHWFDVPAFHREVRRVARPGALLAEWGYGLPESASPSVNAAIREFYQATTGPFWEPERAHIDDGYARLPFPFDSLATPEIVMEVFWTRDQMLGFLRSWSAVQTCIRKTGRDPIPLIQSRLEVVWPASRTLTVRFPVFLRVGRV